MASVEYLGIDVGGTNVKMGIVDANTGKISNFYSHDTISWRESGHFVDRFGDAVALQLLSNKEVKQVGIGLPGMLNRERTIPLEITAIPEINGIPMVDILTKRFPGTQFYLANDANAAALKERLGDEDALEVIGGEPRLPLVIAKVRDSEPFDENLLVAELAQRRAWLVPAYQLPPDNDEQRIIRILVKINQTRELADALADDVHDSIIDLRKRAAGEKRKLPVHTGHGY